MRFHSLVRILCVAERLFKEHTNFTEEMHAAAFHFKTKAKHINKLQFSFSRALLLLLLLLSTSVRGDNFQIKYLCC